MKRVVTVIVWGLAFIVVMLPAGVLVRSNVEEVENQWVNDVADRQVAGMERMMVGPTIEVQVVGAVVNPGVYTVKVGATVADILGVVEVKEGALIEKLNLAKPLRNGQRIDIKQESRAATVININIANRSELMSLRGVGETMASAIIEYRARHGAFHSIEELVEVDGMSERKLNRIRSAISY
jgi:competence ComEA-like helix-hairpin-helix protein